MGDFDRVQICFITTTQYHFLVTDIYSRYLYDHYGITPTVLYRRFDNFDISRFDVQNKYHIVPYTANKNSIIGQSIFAFRCGYLFRFSEWNTLLDREKRIILFVFNDRSKLTQKMIDIVKEYDSNNMVVLVEEGFDTYSDSLDIKHERIWCLKHKISKALFGIGRTSKVIGDNPQIDTVIVNKPERYAQLNKARNQEIIQQSPNLLLNAKEFAFQYAKARINSLECDVLYLGQPYYKDGQYNEHENECISFLFSALPNTASILIKPHPREHTEKYKKLLIHDNVTIMSDDVAALPIETLIGITKVKIVITIQSSAAITLANLFPSIVVFVLRNIPEAKIMLEKAEEAGEELPQIDDSFFAEENSNVFLPDTINCFRELVRKHLVKAFAQEDTTDNINMSFPEMDALIKKTRM